MIVMDITIHTSFLPHDDPDASLAFYRDALGFEVRSDVGQGRMRWITVGPVGQPGTSIVLAPPAVGPGVTDDERRTITEMMAKGSYAMLLLSTPDLDAAFEQLQAGDVEVVLTHLRRCLEHHTPRYTQTTAFTGTHLLARDVRTSHHAH